jgi:hypothetical protein
VVQQNEDRTIFGSVQLVIDFMAVRVNVHLSLKYPMVQSQLLWAGSTENSWDLSALRYKGMQPCFLGGFASRL